MNEATCARASDFATQAQAFHHIHAQLPLVALVPNLHSRIESLTTGAGPLPITVHDSRAGDAWVCSPRTTYADCAAEEAARYLPAWATPVLRRLPTLGGRWLEAMGIDHAVTLNNWLLSTNLYPALRDVDPRAVVAEACQRWPEHTLWFRSLNDHENRDWLHALCDAGCDLVVSRQVYLYQEIPDLIRRHVNLKRDLALFDRTALQYCGDEGFVPEDYARIAELYAMLYNEKYSRLNPTYSEAFLRLWHQAGLLEFHGFRDAHGSLQTVVGLFRQNGVATSPIVGYDTSQPRSLGLYRLATTCAYRVCLRRGWRLNFSAGAADFKRVRGGQPAIEYSAVFSRHLPRRTQMTLAALSTATCRIGAPLLSHYLL